MLPKVKQIDSERYKISAMFEDISSQATLQWNRNRELIPYRYLNPLNLNIPPNPILRYVFRSATIDILKMIKNSNVD